MMSTTRMMKMIIQRIDIFYKPCAGVQGDETGDETGDEDKEMRFFDLGTMATTMTGMIKVKIASMEIFMRI